MRCSGKKIVSQMSGARYVGKKEREEACGRYKLVNEVHLNT